MTHIRLRLPISQGLGRLLQVVALAALPLSPGAVTAQENSISIELNKLEPKGPACRIYLVINNKSDTDYRDVSLDLVLFRPDGIIGRNFKINLAPLKAKKRIVKLFDLDIDGKACEQVGSFLINDALECTTPAGPVDDCLSQITVSTLTNVQLTK